MPLVPEQVIPSALVLHLALADVHEATGDVAAAKAVYEGLAAPLEVADAQEADKDGNASKDSPAESAVKQVMIMNQEVVVPRQSIQLTQTTL